MSATFAHPPRVLCCGIAVRDLVFRVQTPPARGSKASAHGYFEITGGNAVNAAIGIAHLGGHVDFVGPMGDPNDANAERILADLDREGIGRRAVVRVAGATTPTSGILLDAEGERTIVTYRDPKLNDARCADPAAALGACSFVCADNRFPEFTHDIGVAARQRDIPVLLDVDRAMPMHATLLTIATHVVFSAEGLRSSTAIEDLPMALQHVATVTPAFLAVTCGENGLLWRDPQGTIQHLPAFPVAAVDTLGAGDVFHGALALALAEGQAALPALRFASAAAALKCTRLGGAFATPNRAAVESLLETTPAVQG